MHPLLFDFDTIALPCLILSMDNRCVDCNTAFLDVFDIPAATGKTLDDFLPNTTIDDLKRKTLVEIDDETSFKPYVTKTRYEDGDAYLLLLANTTELSSSSALLEKAVSEASAMVEMKSNFLATMSHEIRTPMQSIFGLLELIGEEKPKQAVMDMVGTAKESASGLLEILDEILDLAKLDSDKLEFDDFEVPIRLLARGTLEAVSVRKGGPRVAVLDEIDQDVPFVIKGDPKRLRQIIMNFMSNALKFTKEGHVKLKIHRNTQHLKEKDGALAIRFEVEDTGMGMSEEVRNKLFQPFVQADNSTARKFGGTGLGLSICKKLVEAMEGKIGVESTEGKGSTFWFEIPTEEIATDQTSVELPNLDGIAVLSVEDHPQGAKEIMNSLKSMGAEVVSCPTYEEGLNMAKRRPFDVAVVDQGLPDGLGIDLMKEFAEIRPFMGQILYTVRDDYGLQHSCRAMGATYLAKPASRAGLGETVKDAASAQAQYELQGPKRLLIAEDTPTVQDVLKRQLSLLGVEADFVDDGRQALDAMKSGNYGILITDLHMPEVDGYQVIREIRQQEETSSEDEHTPVIVLTADVQMAQRQAYLLEGFDECLLKPVTLGQFRRLLIRWGLLSEDDAIEATTKTNAESSSTKSAEQDIVDLDAVKAQMGAVNEDTLNMIGMFVDMSTPLIESLREHLESGNMHALSEVAHSLKGGSRSACCMALGNIAEKLQDDAAAKEDCTALVAQAEEEFAKIKPALEKIKAA